MSSATRAPLGHVGLLFMRVIAGSLFAAHGYPKLFGGPGKTTHPLAVRYLGEGFSRALERGGVTNFSNSLSRQGVPAPKAMAVLVGMTEFVGGLLLIAGIFTRAAAGALAVTMVVAIKLVHWKQGMIGSASGYMYGLSMLAGMLGLLCSGPGILSVHHDSEQWLVQRFRRGRHARRPEAIPRKLRQQP